MEGLYANSGIFMLIAVALIALEIFWRIRKKQGYDFGSFGSTLVIFIGQALSSAAYAGVITLAWTAAYQIAPFQWDISDWRVWLAAFFLVEFTYYWQHRLSHTVRWMWATHAVHHSPNQYVLPAAFRLGWTGVLSGGWLLHLPLCLLGFHPAIIATILVTTLRFQFFLHTENIGRLGPLEWVFNTPSNHRVHHSSQPHYLDKNFGNVLMIFDHLFGSYAAEKPGEEIRYGLTDPFVSKNPFYIATREWIRMAKEVRNASSWRVAWASLFGRPAPSDEQSLEAPTSRPSLTPEEATIQ